MIERQHRVRLATAEIRLELHHRVSAGWTFAPQPLERPDKQPLEAVREKGPTEKLHRVTVFVAAFSEINLP